MPIYFMKLIPVITMFLVGYLTRKLKIFSSKDADRLLQLVLNITLPALSILSLAQLKIETNLLYIVLYPFIIVLITFLPANFITKRLSVSQKTKGSFLVGSLIINTGFVSTFIFAFFGKEGFGYYSLFDLGNSFMIYFFAYYQAIRYSEKQDSKLPIKKMLALPPVWGVMVGLILNLVGINLSAPIASTLEYIGNPTMPLIIFSLGIYFNPKLNNLKLVLSVLFFRMVLGFLLGLAIVKFFHLTSIIKHITLICATAPVGFNTLIFSELEELDKEFAATIVSFSLIIAIIFITVYSIFWI